MGSFKTFGRVLLTGLLALALTGLLGAYWVVVSNLPSRIYTEAQQEYLHYNAGRDISQVAPTLNAVLPNGEVVPTILPVGKSRVRATLTARYEEQEGVSVTVFDLDFRGEYHLAHSGSAGTMVQLFFPFPSNLETLHEVRFLVDNEEPLEAHYSTRGISWQTWVEPGQARQITIVYKASGANSFSYGLHHEQRSDLDVTVTVLGLTGSEVPADALAATTSTPTEEGEVLAWDYTNLIADRDIRLNLPARLSFSQRVAQLQGDFSDLATLAPLLVGLFLAALAGQLHLSGTRLRVEIYLLAGCGLALFYPGLTFLSGLVDVTLAGGLALLAVSALLLLFLGFTTGWRQTWWRVAVLLLVFPGFFSLGMLTPWRGLLLTGGGLLLVASFMLVYARRPAAVEPEPVPAPRPIEKVPDPTPEPAGLHCPYCARALSEDFRFCPGCGRDTAHFHRCGHCGREQFVPDQLESVYCLHCGQLIK